MRSKLGFFAAIAFLITVPMALLAQILFGSGADLIIHFGCGLGFALSSIAVFDFKLPKWMNWIGFLSTGAAAVIFLLQGVSNLMPNIDWLFYIAFQVLGQGLESWLIDLFMLWFVAMLFIDSQGKTKIFGIVVMSLVVFSEAYRYGEIILGGSPTEVLKLVPVLAIVWFLLESTKKNPKIAAPTAMGSSRNEAFDRI
jgi:hypothetical protein